MKIDFKKLIISVVVCQLAGVVGSVFTFSSISNWYVYLNKPSFNPPNWIFGPVWTVLFLLMGISLYIIWNNKAILQKNKKREAINIFVFQLFLNVLWTLLFFGLKSPALAFFEITVLWMTIFITIFKFKKFSSLAAWLLIPYLLWVSFASVLNFALWALN
ncbi:MAG: TspO protein [Candidatus Magasanikbacteria bacterium CG_4_10_14_0_8_um_filter_32_14]|uniref:TspO protein n=1 Tax=Candidatus Magasanikbacteria bacterium CG_4_10_14_0_8_um_filter_32_14 TaxID=1974640 RepID=A0A2M7RAP3_9BACT|nr:MAG: TspO protein [Candidatus Magasanikbacteria bacterium CG_4_10_14_0_8_um_filter_32_14]